MTASDPQAIDARLNLLEGRLVTIETRLGIVPTSIGTPKSHVIDDTSPNASVADQPASGDSVTAPQLPVRPPPLPTWLSTEPPLAQPAGASSHDPPVVVPVVVAPPVTRASIPYAPVVARAPAVQGELERTIGLKWAGWAGAVVLVIGAALAVKFIYDQHWFARVPPEVWLGAIFAAGLALIATGEYVYRRVHQVPAASLFGAGVATLFLAGYVGQAYYNLYTPSTALTLMAVASLVGAAVAIRGNLVSIAVLSLIGGNVAPILVGSPDAPLPPFLIYLLALQTVALTLAFRGRGQKWWTLRGLSLATTSLWILQVLARPQSDEQLTLLFCAIYALIFHAELIASALLQRNKDQKMGGGGSGTFAILVTAAITAVTLWVSRGAMPRDRGAILLGLSGVSAIVGWALARSASHRPLGLSIAHRIASAALLTIAIPVGLSGLQIEIGWAVLAVSFAAMGALVPSALARRASVCTWLLAVLHLGLCAGGQSILGGHAAVEWFTWFGTSITSHMVLGWGLALVGHAIARLLMAARVLKDEERPGLRQSAVALSTTATVLWCAVSLLGLPPAGATLCMALYAWLLIAADSLAPELALTFQATAVILFAAAKWAIFDTVMGRLSSGWSPADYRPVLNPLTGNGVLLAASVAGLYALKNRVFVSERVSKSVLRCNMGFLTLLILVWAGSFEIDRTMERLHAAGSLQWPLWQAKQLAWTIGWTLAAATAFVLLRRRGVDTSPQVRWANALPGVLLLFALKFMTIDTLIWRLTTAPANVAVGANLEAAAGGFVFAALLVFAIIGLPPSLRHRQTAMRQRLGIFAALVLLWCTSIEVDRLFTNSSPIGRAALAEQVALSILWSIFAVSCVILGFRIRASYFRYFGLTLLAITLMKVLLIDMSQVETGHRILSFLGLGGLLLGTSVLYGKLGPRLLSPSTTPSHLQ